MAEEKKKIEKLTPEQEAKMPEYREKWLNIGLSTDSDMDKAKHFAKMSYEKAGLTPPPDDKFEIYDSPMASVKALMQRGVPAQECLDAHIYGCHDAPWLGFYEFFKNECGMEEEISVLDGLFGMAKHCGWWAPMEDFCVLTKKPVEVHMDRERGRLHNPDGPAVRYADGFSVWHIDGVRLNEKIVMRPQELTTEEINDEGTDLDVRRIMVSRYVSTLESGLDFLLEWLYDIRTRKVEADIDPYLQEYRKRTGKNCPEFMR